MVHWGDNEETNNNMKSKTDINNPTIIAYDCHDFSHNNNYTQGDDENNSNGNYGVIYDRSDADNPPLLPLETQTYSSIPHDGERTLLFCPVYRVIIDDD